MMVTGIELDFASLHHPSCFCFIRRQPLEDHRSDDGPAQRTGHPLPLDRRTRVEEQVIFHTRYDIAGGVDGFQDWSCFHHSIDSSGIGLVYVHSYLFYFFIFASNEASLSLPPAGGRQSTWTACAPWDVRLSKKDSRPTLIAARGCFNCSRFTGVNVFFCVALKRRLICSTASVAVRKTVTPASFNWSI